jgi:hypothetical protein
MTINSININESNPVVGLGTQTCNITTAGLYTVAVEYFLPYQAAGSSADSTVTTGGSALQVLVQLNGSTKLTLNAGAPTAPILGGSVRLQCAAGDVITVVPSSSAAADNQLNSVKGILNIYQGT